MTVGLDVVGAKTAGSGPDVTCVVETAMDEVREDEEVDRPSEDGGGLFANCPVLGEDAESSSA